MPLSIPPASSLVRGWKLEASEEGVAGLGEMWSALLSPEYLCRMLEAMFPFVLFILASKTEGQGKSSTPFSGILPLRRVILSNRSVEFALIFASRFCLRMRA